MHRSGGAGDEVTDPIGTWLEERVASGEIPGASWAVLGPEGFISEGAVGRAVVVPEPVEARPDTIYDLASLTKPLVTAFLCLSLRRDLGLGLDDRIGRFLPEVDRLDKRDIRLRHLLTHTAGMPAWVPFYLKGRTMGEYLEQIRERPPDFAPGTRVEYSCAGYLMLGEILRRCATEELDRLAGRTIFDPLGLQSTAFRPPAAWLDRVAATEDSCQYERRLAGPSSASYGGFREGVIRGEVHDQNAYVLGGVAGNAGLFSTACETALVAAEYLGEAIHPTKGLLDTGSIGLAQEDQTPGLNEARTMAFRIASRGGTAAGPDLPPDAFGHNGFTGTSVWIDPGRPRVHVLLTNRVHPRVSDAIDMTALRGRFHTLASRI